MARQERVFSRRYACERVEERIIRVPTTSPLTSQEVKLDVQQQTVGDWIAFLYLESDVEGVAWRRLSYGTGSRTEKLRRPKALRPFELADPIAWDPNGIGASDGKPIIYLENETGRDALVKVVYAVKSTTTASRFQVQVDVRVVQDGADLACRVEMRVFERDRGHGTGRLIETVTGRWKNVTVDTRHEFTVGASEEFAVDIPYTSATKRHLFVAASSTVSGSTLPYIRKDPNPITSTSFEQPIFPLVVLTHDLYSTIVYKCLPGSKDTWLFAEGDALADANAWPGRASSGDVL